MSDKKILKEEDLKKVSGGMPADGTESTTKDNYRYYEELGDKNKIIHKIVREDDCDVAKGEYCGGNIKYVFYFFTEGFKCEKCGEWYNVRWRSCKEIFEDCFDCEIKD